MPASPGSKYVIAPALSATMLKSGKLQWVKAPGDYVREGDTIGFWLAQNDNFSRRAPRVVEAQSSASGFLAEVMTTHGCVIRLLNHARRR